MCRSVNRDKVNTVLNSSGRTSLIGGRVFTLAMNTAVVVCFLTLSVSWVKRTVADEVTFNFKEFLQVSYTWKQSPGGQSSETCVGPVFSQKNQSVALSQHEFVP